MSYREISIPIIFSEEELELIRSEAKLDHPPTRKELRGFIHSLKSVALLNIKKERDEQKKSLTKQKESDKGGTNGESVLTDNLIAS